MQGVKGEIRLSKLWGEQGRGGFGHHIADVREGGWAADVRKVTKKEETKVEGEREGLDKEKDLGK